MSGRVKPVGAAKMGWPEQPLQGSRGSGFATDADSIQKAAVLKCKPL